MSIYSATTDQARIIRVELDSAEVVGAEQTELYVTLTPWPINSLLERLIVRSQNAYSALRVALLSDAAAFRQKGYTPAWIEAQATGGGTVFAYDLDSVPFEDLTRVGAVHLLFQAADTSDNAVPFTDGEILDVRLEGRQQLQSDAAQADKLTIAGDPLWRVLRQRADGTCEDLTASARQADPYIINRSSFVALGSDDEYLWIGTTRPWTSLYAMVDPDGRMPASVTVEATMFVNGSFTTTTLLDNTSAYQQLSGGGYSSFNYSGSISIAPPDGWQASVVSGDPRTATATILNAGGQTIDGFRFPCYPVALFDNPPRLWLRLRAIGLTATSRQLRLRALLLQSDV